MTPEPDQTVDGAAPSQTSFVRQANLVQDLFSVPAPVKRLFDKVPVRTYAANELPRRSPRPSDLPGLYVFTSDRDAMVGKPSFNPACLKWQTFLNIAGIQHRLVPSNNHASPTGVLPFLLPALHAPPQQVSPGSLLPVPSHRIVRFALSHGATVREPASMRYEAYQSLLDHRIRHAWLYALYLDPGNFSAVATPLYINPISHNPLVRATISSQLRRAAEAEILKQGTVIDGDHLLAQADDAFDALSVLLGGEDFWFFGEEHPTLFDASVFAYTHLLLDEEGMGWREKLLVESVRKHDNLIRHRGRLLARYFGKDS